MTQIYEKSEKLRDLLRAVKGWAKPGPYKRMEDKLYLSDNYGIAKVTYDSGAISVQTVMYLWRDCGETVSLEVYD